MATSARPDRFVPLALFLCALLYRLWFLYTNPELTYGVSVLGVPFSDAVEWEKLAESILHGEGMTGPWAAQRPLYPLLLALLYLVTGPSVIAAQLMNIAVSAATAPLVFLTGKRIAGFAPALAVSLAVIVGTEYSIHSLLVMSETLGLFLCVLSVYTLGAAAQFGSGRAAFAAGAFYALSNLTRPLTLLTGPFLGAGLLLIALSSRRERGAALRVFTLFALGAAVFLAPWLLRQYREHGIVALTNKSAESLYAASSKRFGAWTAEIDEEAFERDVGFGIKERYEYFMAEAKKNIAHDPHWYAAHVWEALHLLFAGPAAEERPVATVLLFTAFAFLAAPLAGYPRRAAMIGFLTVVAAALPFIAASGAADWLLIPLGAAAALVAAPARRSAAAALLVLIASAVGLALVYETQNTRFLLLTDWLLLLFTAAALGIPARIAAFRISGAAPPEPELPRTRAPWARRAAWCTAMFIVAGVAVIAWRTYVRPPVQTALPKLSDESAAVFNPDPAEEPLRVLSFESDDKALGRLFIAPVEIDRHLYVIPPKVQLPFNARIFEARPYERTVFQVRLGNGEPSYAIIPGRLDTGWVGVPVVVIGRMNIDIREVYYDSRRIIEVSALIPWDEDRKEFRGERMHAPEDPMHRRFLNFLASKQAKAG